MNIFHWVTTEYIILNMLNTEKKILSSAFNFYFALNFGHFHTFYKNVLIRDPNGIKHVLQQKSWSETT